jgi:hypothetical protein
MPNTNDIKAQLESTKNLRQTTFETQRYFQQAMFKTPDLGKNLKLNLLQQKVAQNISISLGYCVFSKNSPIIKKSPFNAEKNSCK